MNNNTKPNNFPRRKAINPRPQDLQIPKLANSFDSLNSSKKSLTTTSPSPYPNSHFTNFTATDDSKNLKKNKSLSIISKIIPEYEKNSKGPTKKRIANVGFLSDFKVSYTSKKDVIPFKIQELVSKLKESSNDPLESQEICNKLLDEVIRCTPIFAPILKLLKGFFNAKITSQTKALQEVQNKFDELKRKKQEIEFENNNLAFENNELNDRMVEMHEKITDLTDKFIKLSKTDFKSSEMTEENWKKLLQSNTIFQDSLFNLQSKTKYYKNKAAKMAKLITALENKGYPVEDIYLSELTSKKSLPKNIEAMAADDTENENIVTGKPRKILLPVGVPKLEIEDLPSPSFSSEEIELSDSKLSIF